MFIANRLILLVPAALAGLWLWGGQPQRGLVLKTLTGIGVALFISYLCGALWPHPRPFTIGLGHAFFAHKATSSFPSNHTIIIATLAFTLLFDRRWAGWGWATLALAAVVGLSRVYLGVHFPLDIAGGLLLAPLAAALVMPVWRRVGTRDRGVPGAARQAAGPADRARLDPRLGRRNDPGTVPRAVLRPARNPPRLHAPAASACGASRHRSR